MAIRHAAASLTSDGRRIMTRSFSIACIVLQLLLLVTGAAQAGTQFFDGTFNGADRTQAVVLDTSPGQNATFNVAQQLTGGNPGRIPANSADMDMDHCRPFAGDRHRQLANRGHLQPFSTRSDRIDQLFDRCRTARSGWGNPNPFVALLLVQGGKYYSATENSYDTSSHSWTHLSVSGLTASDFHEVTSFQTPPTSPSPDFSASGSVSSSAMRLRRGWSRHTEHDNGHERVRQLERRCYISYPGAVVTHHARNRWRGVPCVRAPSPICLECSCPVPRASRPRPWIALALAVRDALCSGRPVSTREPASCLVLEPPDR